jgi:protoporphyrinogen oxidase
MDGEGTSEFDAVVLGAGITGLVSAAILLEQGAGKVLVVDEYPQAGGNHIDRAIGGYTFDVGSFIFQDDSPLLRWFPELLESYVPIDPSWSRLTPQGVVTEYPFSVRDDLLRAGPVGIGRILGSVAKARLQRKELANAQDFAEYWLGPRLVDRSGLGQYMERFCGIPIDRIDLEFAQSRMGWISEHAKIRTQMQRLSARLRPSSRRGPTGPMNRQLARPRAGFGSLYAPAVERLRSAGAEFRFGARPERLEKRDGGYLLSVGGRRMTAGRVVSTIPIDHALRVCGLAERELPTVTLVSLFFSFEGRRGFDSSIFYNFSHEGSWKRLTVYSDFYGEVDGRTFFAVEVIRNDDAMTVEDAAAEFRKHTADNGLLDGDLRLEGSHVLDHAYPVYSSGSAARALQGVAALREFGLESFGRQGGFQYQPTARVSTQVAEGALGA